MTRIAEDLLAAGTLIMGQLHLYVSDFMADISVAEQTTVFPDFLLPFQYTH